MALGQEHHTLGPGLFLVTKSTTFKASMENYTPRKPL